MYFWWTQCITASTVSFIDDGGSGNSSCKMSDKVTIIGTNPNYNLNEFRSLK